MSKIHLKTANEIEIMAEGGKALAAIRDALILHVLPGVTTKELENIALKLIKQSGGESTFKGFHDYPAATCISINEQVVHGIPSERVIKSGDLVGIDVGLRYKGWCTDTAITVAVGSVSDKLKQLLDVTRESMYVGIKQVKPGAHVGDIGSAISEYVAEFGFGIVRDLTGHGLGRQPHEEPSVPNFGKAGSGPELQVGMVIAIEPMVTLGKPAVSQLADGWTIATIDGSPAAHFEHTLAVTKDGYQILT